MIAAEDDGFVDHDGVDWEAMQKAYEKNKKEVVSGGSTITQQLAKKSILVGERSYLRKGGELIITICLETCMDKERILEIYLNVVEWGVGVFGAEAAHNITMASVLRISLSTASRKTGGVMLPKPRYYDKNQGSAYLQKRTDMICVV